MKVQMVRAKVKAEKVEALEAGIKRFVPALEQALREDMCDT